jgi:hypothetical protein
MGEIVMGIKRIVGVAVASMVLAGPSQVASAQSSNIEVLAFRGFGASAVFRTIEGCIATEVFVSAGESSAVGPGEPRTVKQDAAAVLVDRRDWCTGEVLLFGSGSGPVEFDVAPLLRSAEVHGVVPFHDVPSDRTLDVVVDVVWTGVGELERDASHSHFVDEGVVVKTHSNGSFRNATAVGQVVQDTTELVDGSTSIGLLVWSNNGQVLSNRGA